MEKIKLNIPLSEQLYDYFYREELEKEREAIRILGKLIEKELENEDVQ